MLLDNDARNYLGIATGVGPMTGDWWTITKDGGSGPGGQLRVQMRIHPQNHPPEIPRTEGRRAQVGTERDRRLQPLPALSHRQDPPHRTEERAEEDRRKRPAPPDERTDHRQQLDVAASHPLGPADLLVQERGRIEDPAPQQRTRETPLPIPAGEKGKEETRGEPAEGEFVGDDPVVDVDEGDRDQKGEEEEVAQQRDPGTVQKKDRPEPGRGEQFDRRVPPGDRPPAPGAFPPEERRNLRWGYSPTPGSPGRSQGSATGGPRSTPRAAAGGSPRSGTIRCTPR